MSFDGNWNITINTQMGAQNATLQLKTEGSALTGQLVSPQGSVEITEGKVDGDKATWKAALEQPMPITIEATATVNGDEISGEVQLGSFGSAPFSGTRA